MGGLFFVGNGEGIEALAKPIFVRGASLFNGSGTAAPFYGSGTAVPFNGSGSADWRVPLLGLGFEIWEIGAELYQLFLKFSRVDFMD